MNSLRLIIGAPVYNEADGVLEFLSQIDLSAKTIVQNNPKISVEVLFVNDGSKDETVSRIQGFKPSSLKRIRVLNLSRNCGHTAAVCAIIDSADGDALILMDADLQDKPEVLPDLVDAWVSGQLSVRVSRGRREEGHLFAIGSRIFYSIYQKLSGLRSYVGIFGLYDRRVVEALRRFPEIVRYHPGLFSLVGFKTQYIEVTRAQRLHGESRVGFLKLIKLANQAIFSFSTIPILIVTSLGMVIAGTSFLTGIGVIAIKLFTDSAIPGWASIVALQLFLTGLVIFSLGIIGQYIAIIVEEVKRRPKYQIESELQIVSHG